MEGNPFFEDYYNKHSALDYLNKDKSNLWSIITAYSHNINYSYSYLVHYLNLRNKNYGWYSREHSYKNVEVPTEEEFLDILEFRESEINRVIKEYEHLKLTITDPKYWETIHDWEYWQWPNEWGVIDWNEPIFNYIEEYNIRQKNYKRIHGNPFTKNGEEDHHAWHFSSRDSDDKVKADLWSNIAAYSHTINYNYDYLVRYIKLRNKRYENNSYHRKLPIPTEEEFLEILEFRESEINRIYNNIGEPSWDWPIKWGNVSWNSHIDHYIDDYDWYFNPTNNDFKKRLETSLENLRNEIKTFKIYLGHNDDYYLKRKKDALISLNEEIYRFKIFLGHNSEYKLNDQQINTIVQTFNFFKKNKNLNSDYLSFPKIIVSLDMPISLKKSKTPRNMDNIEEKIEWNIDGILGEFIGSDHSNWYKACGTKIILYKRAIKKCSESLSIFEPYLLKVVLIHEFCHFILFSICRDKNNYHTKKQYNNISTELNETFAQFFTYISLNYNLGDYSYVPNYPHRNSDNPEEKAFNELLKHQSNIYNRFKDIQNMDIDKVINSIDKLIEIDNATVPDWINLLK